MAGGLDAAGVGPQRGGGLPAFEAAPPGPPAGYGVGERRQGGGGGVQARGRGGVAEAPGVEGRFGVAQAVHVAGYGAAVGGLWRVLGL